MNVDPHPSASPATRPVSAFASFPAEGSSPDPDARASPSEVRGAHRHCPGWFAWLAITVLCWSVVAAALPGFGSSEAMLSREHVDALFTVDVGLLGDDGSDAEAAFGRWLFDHEIDGVSCSGCHDMAQLGQDRRSHGRNTPALVDVGRQLVFGWDGRETGLQTMLRRELATRCGLVDERAVHRIVAADSELRERLEVVYPGQPPTGRLLVQALQAHLSRLRTRGRWDRFVEGDDAALTPIERDGLAHFIELGCAICHRGRNLGGVSAHVLGQAVPFASEDLGLFEVTRREEDRNVFKAPMLRHVANTGPYLHDGSVHDLGDAVRLMGRHELGKELTDDQVGAIVALLQATAASELE